MRVLVCGGRHYDDWSHVFDTLDHLHAERGIDLVIHGACQQRGMLSGADRWAQRWAEMRELPYLGHPARWGEQGNKAGPIRNAAMLRLYRPHVVVGFPGGRGTAGMLKLATEAGVEVVDLRHLYHDADAERAAHNGASVSSE